MVHYFQFHNSKQQIRPLRCLEERSLLYEWAVQYSKHRWEGEKQNMTGPNKSHSSVCSQGHPPRVRAFDQGCSLENPGRKPKRWCRQFSKQTNNRIGLRAQRNQNTTQIIQIIKKRNKVSLYERSLTSFSDWCKHCNMLDMCFFFFLFPCTVAFIFLNMFFSLSPISVALRSAPLQPVTTFSLQTHTILKLRAKALLSSENVRGNAISPIQALTLFCD